MWRGSFQYSIYIIIIFIFIRYAHGAKDADFLFSLTLYLTFCFANEFLRVINAPLKTCGNDTEKDAFISRANAVRNSQISDLSL